VGTALFLVILFFFFSNVFLWHDQITREMDQVVVDRMNSGIKLDFMEDTGSVIVLTVSNVGGLDVRLSRLWIVNSTQSGVSNDDHVFGDFEPWDIHIAAGGQRNITLMLEGTENSVVDGKVDVKVYEDRSVIVNYFPPSENVMFRVLTNRANIAGCNLK
jgi:hypothetical protein